MPSFSVDQHVISFGAAILEGFGEGSAVDVTPPEKWVITTGVDGQSVRTATGRRDYLINITLMQTSLSNDILSALAILDEESVRKGFSGAGVLPFSIVDLGGTTRFTSPRAFIMKQPDIAVSNKTTDRVWQLGAFQSRLFAGGNAL